MLKDRILYEEIQNKSDYVKNDTIRIWYDSVRNELWIDRNSHTRFNAPIYLIYKYIKTYKPIIIMCNFDRCFNKLHTTYEYNIVNNQYKPNSDSTSARQSDIINSINVLLKGSVNNDIKSN